MSDDSFRLLMWLLMLQESHWRANYAIERCNSEFIDIGGEG